MTDEVEVTQADRIAAAAIAVLPEMRELILAGRADHHAEPFARHRQEALKQALKIARAAQYSPSPATDTMRGIEGLMAGK